MDNTAERLAHHVSKTSFEDLPREVVDETKKFILDTVGVGLAGVGQPGCKEAVELAREWFSSKNGSTIIYYGYKVSPPEAAFVNSVFMHAHDFDDTYDPAALHANVSALPAALATAQTRGSVTGKELITAVALGVDVICRLGGAATTPLSWIRSATCGFFGAAAAAAKTMKASHEEILNAMGIAYAQTAGTVQAAVDGALVKRMQPGFAARSAVLSSALASRGVTGVKHMFEGDNGFFSLYERGNVEAEKITRDLGDRFAVMDLSIKPYPSCRLTHGSIDAALELAGSHPIDPKDIDEILVSVAKMNHDIVGAPFEIRTNPTVDAQFSIPYTVAVALTKGSVLLDDFIPETVKKAHSLMQLAKKVKVNPNPEVRPNDAVSSKIEIRMVNGTVFSTQVEALKGSPEKPMSFDECAVKFKNCLQYTRDSALIEKSDLIIDFVANLDTVNDVGKLFNLIQHGNGATAAAP